ncbi:Transposase, IS4 family protein (plasmid) [Acidiphilium sp. PM]|nr:Transposase, IS4 family protein [Acidiphilium sp. PM]
MTDQTAGSRSPHVERFFAWINRNRRLAKDFEAKIESAEAFLYAASSILLLRRLAR